MRRILCVTLLAGVLIGCSATDETPSTETVDETSRIDFESLAPGEQFDALNRQFSEARVKNGAEPIEFVDQFWSIVEHNPDDPIAFAALNWIATLVENPEHRDRALDQLAEKYIDRKALGRYCTIFAEQPPTEGAVRFLEALIARSPHEDVQAMALLALGTSLARSPTDQRDDSRVVSLLQRVIDDYGDRTELKQMAEDALFEFQHLAVGRIAPEIEGKDLDGQAFRLSDYRGKVVMLDFWGDW